MATPIPTQLGDVLILATTKSYTAYAVGRVSTDGQQDLSNQKGIAHLSDRAAALLHAKALLMPGRRVFLQSIDTGEWSAISD